MKTHFPARILMMVGLMLVSGALAAQPPWAGWRGSGGWGPGGAYQRSYNAQTVRTVSGTVEAVDRIVPMQGMSGGIHLQLKTGQGMLPVHLGPEWFIERLDTRIAKGDKVEVKGSMVKFDGKDALIAAEVRKGAETLVLRDASGVPMWSGWRR
jgi:hypothetical protein